MLSLGRTMVRHGMRSSIKRSLSASTKPDVNWLDLRGSGMSMFERLSLEEALLRHDPKGKSWIIVGAHDPWPHKYLSNASLELPDYIQSNPNPECVIVMGIGGKADLLLNLPKVKEDRVLVCKRFSGGGTVVLDPSSLWTTVIGRNQDFSSVDPYPKAIMEWSADVVFGPTFEHLTQQTLAINEKATEQGQQTLVMDTKSCSATENGGKTIRIPPSAKTNNKAADIPKFALRENDYVFGDLKMGGNAQSIVKNGWLHHTSFLWDFDPANMDYLRMPAKRPDYRGDRSHEEFLVTLEPHFHKQKNFFDSLRHACEESFEVTKVTLPEAMATINDELGGMNAWWETNRTRIVSDF